MGGKTSKSQLQRSKSFTSFGRSSQRGLFQKTKTKLKQIEKEILELPDSVKQDKIKTELSSIQKTLNDMSDAIKIKNKEKYEDILKHVQEVNQKFEEKTKTEEIETPATEKTNTENTETIQVSEAEKNTSNQVLEEVEMRQHVSDDNVKPESPKIKFGVQVMPIQPRVSQEMLKRTTNPISENVKEEFQQIRNTLESSVRQSITFAEKNKMDEVTVMTEIYSEHFPKNINHFTKSELEVPKPSSVYIDKANVEIDAFVKIESIRKDIDELEYQLRYFSGKKDDEDYIEFNEKFTRILIELDNIDVEGNSVAKQERKILIHRAQELLSILNRLVEHTNIVNGSVEPKMVENMDSTMQVAPSTCI